MKSKRYSDARIMGILKQAENGMAVFSQAILSATARQLSERARKTLQYQTPAEKFAACVTTTS